MHLEQRVGAAEPRHAHAQVDVVARARGGLVREPPGAAELGGDRGVDRAERSRRGGRVVRAARGAGESLERRGVEPLADDADRIERDARRTGGLDGPLEAGLARHVAAVGEQDDDAAQVLLRLERLRREGDRVVERRPAARVDRDLAQGRDGVDRRRGERRQEHGLQPELEDGDPVGGRLRGDERPRGGGRVAQGLACHRA